MLKQEEQYESARQAELQARKADERAKEAAEQAQEEFDDDHRYGAHRDRLTNGRGHLRGIQRNR